MRSTVLNLLAPHIMTIWHGMALMAGLYLALLARSAWKQGEFRQFLVSLAVVFALCAVLAGIVAAVIWIDGR